MDAPNPRELRELADSLGLPLNAEQADEFGEVLTKLLAPFSSVAGPALRPESPEREHWAPEDNPLGAWRWRTDILASSTGALAGRTMAVKDSIGVAGVPMSNGSEALAGFVPRHDAPVVGRALAAGVRILGTATCEEFCVSGGSHTSSPGPVRNPVRPTHSSGGSSSGAAALVASGEVDVALGSDVGGSVRIPAAWCGIYGVKPTHGLVPFTGSAGVTERLDHIGVLSRTVDDLARVLTAVSGADGEDLRQPTNLRPGNYAVGARRELRIAVLAEGFGFPESDPEVDALVRRRAEAFERAGHAVENVSVPGHLMGNLARNVLNATGFASTFERVRSERGVAIGPWGETMRVPGDLPPAPTLERFGPTVTGMALAGEWARLHAPEAAAAAQRLAVELSAAYDAVLESADVIVMPTVPKLPYRLPDSALRPAEAVSLARSTGANTGPFNLTGHPAGTIPCGTVRGFPVGLMVVARHLREDLLLDAMAALSEDLR